MRLRAALFGILVASALFAVECFSVPSSPSWKRTGFKAGWRGSGMDSGKGLRNRVAAPAMGGNEISGDKVKRKVGAILSFEDVINGGMEVFVKYCPKPIMAVIAAALFWPTLWWNQLMKSKKKGAVQRNWYDRVEKGILLGALPMKKVVPDMKKEGVTHVLNMVAEWGGPTSDYAEAGMTQLRVPVIDFTPPSLSDIKKGVEFVKEVVDSGGTVYVHCKAGRGRSASVVMAYLIQEKGMTPWEAQQLLNSKRPHVLQVLHERDVIQEFARGCKQ